MSEIPQPHPQRMHFGLLLLISFFLCNVGFIVNETIRWTNHFDGFLCGVFHAFFFGGIAWGVMVLPWSLLIFVLYRRKKWQNYRTHWVLAPAVLALLVSISSLIIYPPTARHRFKSFAKTHLPENAEHLLVYFSGGGISDYGDEYYFETTPAEVHRLISEMNIHEGDGCLNMAEIDGCRLSEKTTFPSAKTWENSKVYSGEHRDGTWRYVMRVDASETKVFIGIWCN